MHVESELPLNKIPFTPSTDMPPILVDGKMTAGEKRMLEWPGLTALHTLFLR